MVGRRGAPPRGDIARCSLCGRRPPALDCPRCELRALADDGRAPPDPPTLRRRHERREREARSRRALHEQLVATRGYVSVALVGCGRAKRRGRHPARCLYRGTLFRLALSYAEATADGVFILSAKHGLVGLDELLDDYDERLSARSEDRRAWGRRVEASLRLRFVGIPLAIAIYAGAVYADAVVDASAHNRWWIEQPLRGLGIGQRMAWFARRRSSDSMQLPLRLR